MAEEQAPPVVAVVVSSDPGPWLEECLVALTGQDYANLSILVVDAASAEPIAPRVAAIAPDIFLRRLDENAGFGPNANIVLELVQGASYFLFCHDDVLPAPDAVTRMVEEAFRLNAGVVGPKLVDRDEPELILQLGLGVDRLGAPVRRVEHREFDQSQHDEAREVFAVPGACTLVRADLFALLGGFDPAISMFGEDVDLCWRVRVAGARVVVAPLATVAHLEATSSRRRPLPEARALQWRHELRAVLKNYGPVRTVLVAVQLAILSLAEIAYFTALGRRRRARDVIDAWRWNFARHHELFEARRALAVERRLPDRVVGRLFTRRTMRLWRYLRPLLEDRVLHWQSERGDPLSRHLAEQRATHRERRPRAITSIAVVASVLLVFGSRLILSGHLPLVGGLAPIPNPPHLLANFLGGTTDAGTQRPGPATPAVVLLGLGGFVVFGAMGVVLKVIMIAAVVLGAIGVARLVRPFGPPVARLVAGLAYLFLPLAWDDLSRGDLLALIAFGGAPWICARLARASGAAPFASGPRAVLGSRETVVECLGFAVLLAVLGAFIPLIVILCVALALALALALELTGDRKGAIRELSVTSVSAVLAFALCFPWSLTFIQPGTRWSVLSGAGEMASRSATLSALFRFDLGPIGKGVLGYAFLAAALLVLLVGRGERFNWGARRWVVASGLTALAWAASEGWIGSGGGDLSIFIAPTAVCISVLIGLGAASLVTDVASDRFGWRHLVTVGFGICALAGLLPVLGASRSGRWGLPSNGYDSVLSFTTASGSARQSTRLLWLGDPGALPLRGWQVASGYAAAVSAEGLPDALRLWPSANPGEAAHLIAAVNAAQSGKTVRLGALLAADGVRYIVVPTATAPDIESDSNALARPAPQGLLDGLAAQSDLHELPSEGGSLVFESTVWRPGVYVAPSVRGDHGTPSLIRVLGVVAELLMWVAVAGFFIKRRSWATGRRARRGPSMTHRAHDHGEHAPRATDEGAELVVLGST